MWFLYSSGVSRITLQEGTNSFGIWALSIVAVIFIGTRPISGAFVDMTTYTSSFLMATDKGKVAFEEDPFFSLLIKVNADYFSIEAFFFLCAVLYVMPLAFATRRHHGTWGFAALLAFVGAFSFFSYGVNGIRHGMAASLAVLAIAFYDRKIFFVLIGLLAIGTHKSMLLPLGLFALTHFVKIPYLYAVLWTLCLIVNLAVGESATAAIGTLLPINETDLRAQGYFGIQGNDKGGFRLDFILYSIVPVLISHFLADPRAREEIFYRRLLSTYLAANAFWLLVMYAAYSNRFAYISWFILPWVIMTPHLPKRDSLRPSNGYPRSPALIGAAIVAHFSFTYVMFVFVYN